MIVPYILLQRGGKRGDNMVEIGPDLVQWMVADDLVSHHPQGFYVHFHTD